MKRFIFGFQRRVWCPKWTPLSSSWRMVTTAMSGGSLIGPGCRGGPGGPPPWRPVVGRDAPDVFRKEYRDQGGRRPRAGRVRGAGRGREEDARGRPRVVVASRPVYAQRLAPPPRAAPGGFAGIGQLPAGPRRRADGATQPAGRRRYAAARPAARNRISARGR